jgi:nucleotide-binding universal stress UspA family protein
VTFYLDENLPPRIAEMLRARGLDAVSAHEVSGNIQLDDRTQLLYAAGARRAMVTCDIEDFAELTGEFIAANREHAGIVLVPPSFRTDEFAAIADAVEQVARNHPDGLAGAVVFLKRSQRSF